MSKKVLVVIDYTVDFVAENGKLTCGEPGQKLERYITNLTSEFSNNNDFVVMGVDYHKENDEYHPEHKLFSPHNIEGTEGRDLYGSLGEWYEANKEKANVYWMDKTRYSAFTGTDLEIKLRERGITEVHLVGVCTDICILHTAIEAYNKGFEIYIHEGGVASFNQVAHDWALSHMKNVLGANIV